MQKEKLFELLKDAETLKSAFDTLNNKHMSFTIHSIDNTDDSLSIIYNHKDYAILATTNSTFLHPYASQILYEPLI